MREFWVAASLLWFAAGLWTPLVLPLVAVALTFVGQLGWQYFVEGREKRQVKKLFSRYVPKDVYHQLLDDPARAALGGRRRKMTVLFSDVRGFTALSEKVTPEEVVSLLNEYFSRMVRILFEHRGTLAGVRVAFLGDGNNVAHSWIEAAARLGFDFVLARPPGYEPDAAIAAEAGGRLTVTHDEQARMVGPRARARLDRPLAHRSPDRPGEVAQGAHGPSTSR